MTPVAETYLQPKAPFFRTSLDDIPWSQMPPKLRREVAEKAGAYYTKVEGRLLKLGGSPGVEYDISSFAWEATTRKNFRIQGGCLETTNSQVEDLFGFPRKWSSGVTS